MTTEEYLVARKSPCWRFNRVVDNESFSNVNPVHPLKQRIVKDIVASARNDRFIRRIIIFGSSIRYDCDVNSDLDICIEWSEACYDEDGVLKPFTRNIRRIISSVTSGNADVVNYDYLDETLIQNAVERGVVVYEHDVW